MTARASFRLCLAFTAVPLLPAALGLYHFLVVQTSNPSHPPIADLCLIAYKRSMDAAGHVAIFALTGLLIFLLVRWLAILFKGWRETRQISRLEVLASSSAEWARVASLPIDRAAKDNIDLVNAEEAFAVTVGYFAPRVLVSAGLIKTLDDLELEAVLRHEAAHLRNRDPLRLLISDCCQKALPFVPIVGHVAKRFRIAKEVEADTEAIIAMGSASPLASALAKVLVAMPTQTKTGAGLTPTEARIDALLGKPLVEDSSRSLLITSALSTPALATFSLFLYLLTSSPHLTPMHICPV